MHGSCYTHRARRMPIFPLCPTAPVMTDSVVTRFPRRPTGFLHIGGARTALFNWLYARKHGGKMLLRIEDTIGSGRPKPAIAAILDGLKWLGLDWDAEVIYQFTRAARHREVVETCCQPARPIAATRRLGTHAMREKARAEGVRALRRLVARPIRKRPMA